MLSVDFNQHSSPVLQEETFVGFFLVVQKETSVLQIGLGKNSAEFYFQCFHCVLLVIKFKSFLIIKSLLLSLMFVTEPLSREATYLLEVVL